MIRARIRRMTPVDVPAASAALIRSEFGDRSSWLSFAIGHAECVTLIAERDGEIVGTGVGTANGRAGWLATIWVTPDLRQRGIGRAMTQAIVDELAARGCRTFVLVATEDGRRLYEAMGFETQTRYVILEAPGVGAEDVPDQREALVRSFEPADLEAVLALDRRATGEVRRHVIEPFASATSARILEVRGEIRGYVIRAPWGGGATIAVDQVSALRLLDARRRTSGSSGRVRVGLLDDNRAGLAALEGQGYSRVWSAPRMARGAALDWEPTWIWGQFNHAVG